MSSVERPRAAEGRAPNVFRKGGWVPMRQYPDDEDVDFAIVGTGAGGSTLAYKLARAGFKVVAFEAGPFWRPLEDFASDEEEQQKLYWTDTRITGGRDPIQLGGNNSGRGVGGSTVHFTMVVLRFRPEWFKSRSLLGYGVDWPISWKEMWRYYDEVEDMLQISGPISYPWGPHRGRYPRRAHKVNAAGLVLARGCERMGIDWVPTPLATLSSPRGKAHPCVYRGFCVVGCSTNAKQSALVTWIPRAIEHGAEIRDLAMVGQVEMGNNGRATGVLYQREGEWRRQRAKHVVLAGYSIETPRLLLNSANGQFPDGLATGRGVWGMELRREMTRYNHVAGLKMVGEVESQAANRVELAEEKDQFDLNIPRVSFSYSANDRRLIRHAERFMCETIEAAGGKEVWVEADTAHLMGGCRMGSDPRESVTDADGRTWEIPNLWICDGSLFPTGGGVNPSGTIMALACRIGDRMVEMGRKGEL